MVVNDADVRAVTGVAAARLAVPGGTAARTAEVCRRLAGASGWLRLATTPVWPERLSEALAVAAAGNGSTAETSPSKVGEADGGTG